MTSPIISYAGGERRNGRRIGPLATAVFMAVMLVPLGWFTLGRDGPFPHIVRGNLFTSGFDTIHAGSALDQPTIRKWFLIFGVFGSGVLPFIAAGRWLSDRTTRAGYWAFTAPAAALCLCLLSILTVPFCWLIQYIGTMGFTPRRVQGLIFGVCGYAVVAALFCWVARAQEAKQPMDAPLASLVEPDSRS